MTWSKIVTRLIRALLVTPVGWPLPASGQTPRLEAADTAWISLSEVGPPERRSPTLDDVLDLHEVGNPVVSPDGRSMAFLVRQAFRACNCYRTALFLVPTTGEQVPTRLLEEESLSDLHWTPDGRFLTYLSSRGGSRQLWRLSPRGGRPEIVFTHTPGEGQTYYESALGPQQAIRIGIDLYEWSPDGSQVAFVTRPSSDSGLVRRLVENGVRYDDDRMGVRDILLKQWSREPAELWIYDVAGRQERRLWSSPTAGVRFSYGLGIPSIAWSPDGHRIALTYAANISTVTAVPNFDLGIISAETGRFSPLVSTDSMLETTPVWSPDGAEIAFGSAFLTGQDLTGRLASLGIVTPATRRVRYIARGHAGRSIDRVWWARGGRALVFETASPAGVGRALSGLYRAELASDTVRRETSGEYHVSDCSAAVRGQIACVRQNPNVPPDPAVVDLETGESRPVASTNLQVRRLALVPVTELRWTDDSGIESNGYLIRPARYRLGKRYPFVVLLYGFQGRFTLGAEWITSYPSQALAQAGFVVLLANYPRYDAWPGDDFARGSVATGYGALASLQAVVRRLGREGLVDTTRVGVAGWSYGGFLAEFAITHSRIFSVASVGDDGDCNPGAYWLVGWRGYRRFMETTLGGPPYGATLGNWVMFSPAQNADQVRIPVLMEASAEEAPAGLEMYSALRYHGIPVDFVIYPDEGHVFTQPVHRLASMRRNLDWFLFWLQGREDRDSREREQYSRWRSMRNHLQMPVDSGETGPTRPPGVRQARSDR